MTPHPPPPEGNEPPPAKKRAKPFSATQATRKHLKSLGITSQITERWNAFAKVRQDLFGFIDLVALDTSVGIIGIQTTTMDNMAARRTKIEELETLSPWLLSGGIVEVWGWGKRGGRGKRKLWTLRRERLVGPGNWVTVDEGDAIGSDGDAQSAQGELPL